MVLGGALLLVSVLGLIGLRVEDKLKPTSLEVPGTESANTERSLQRYFGDSAPFAIVLHGPAKALDREGPRLIHVLRREHGVTTLSPWDAGSVNRLRPAPSRCVILVDFHVDPEEAVERSVPRLDGLLRRTIKPPVQATEAGYASLSRAIQDESISATERGEILALPVLLVVLLLVFRSPIAALIPLAFGAITVIASRGVLALVTAWLPIDAFALTVSTMMGLALGVDYALLMVSRFREELSIGNTPRVAARATRRTAGRTILFAASALLLSMLVAVPILPGALLISLAGTVVIVVALSAGVATFVAPALLEIVGPHIDRWRVGPAPANRSRLLGVVGTCLRRPLVASLLIGGLVLILAVPAIGLKTGPPSPEQLPDSNQARKDAEEVDSLAGPGWEAPFVLLASTSRGTVTQEPFLAELAKLQKKIASDPEVKMVIGPGQVASEVKPLREATAQLLHGGKKSGQLGELYRLGSKLARAEGGVGEIRFGLKAAAAGAGLLGIGSNRAARGAGQIAGGLRQSLDAGRRALRAIGRLEDASRRLASGQGEAKAGSLALRLGLTHLLKDMRPNALRRAREIQTRLRSIAEADPAVAPVLREVGALAEHLAINRSELEFLRGEAEELHSGESRLLSGGVALHRGATRLAAAGRELPHGLGTLTAGAKRLASGLSELRGGARHLEGELDRGFRSAYPLEAGLHRASVKVVAESEGLNRKVSAVRRSSPSLFKSGYFVLSAVDGAPVAKRKAAASAISLERGGQAAAILVIPRHTFNTPGSIQLYERLKREADGFTRDTGLKTGVTGGAARLTDYASVTRQAIPFVVLAITIATFIVLVIVLRALLLAALAVALNLVTVGVAFGVLTLLFNVPSGYPLGGHSYVDAVGATAIFGVVFGLSIDYAVFLLTRMRERHQQGFDNADAVYFGLERTAGVITGAAAIMLAVFVAFAGAPIATISQLGVGLAVAVLLDATVVRIVLLPALMILFGERVWWLPAPLKRLLPELDLHGDLGVKQPA